jgi:hypothetical protein
MAPVSGSFREESIYVSFQVCFDLMKPAPVFESAYDSTRHAMQMHSRRRDPPNGKTIQAMFYMASRSAAARLTMALRLAG